MSRAVKNKNQLKSADKNSIPSGDHYGNLNDSLRRSKVKNEAKTFRSDDKGSKSDLYNRMYLEKSDKIMSSSSEKLKVKDLGLVDKRQLSHSSSKSLNLDHLECDSSVISNSTFYKSNQQAPNIKSCQEVKQGSSYIAKIDTNQNVTENYSLTPKHNRVSSFKSRGQSPRIQIRGMGSNTVSSNRLENNVNINIENQGSPSSPTTSTFSPNSNESLSTNTSKSSLCDVSQCSSDSLPSQSLRQHRGCRKSASYDGLISEERCRSSLEIRATKAASSEELDSRKGKDNYAFQMNKLSHRSRSNSVDFKIFHKEFTDYKSISIDRGIKLDQSKDIQSRRRSWVVDEARVLDGSKSFRKSDDLDAAIILDVPPKLPPKQRKTKLGAFSSSTDDLTRLEGPIDLKLQMGKMTKSSSVIQVSNVKRLSRGYESAITRQYLQREGSEDKLDHPVALPRKTLPHSLSKDSINSKSHRVDNSSSEFDKRILDQELSLSYSINSSPKEIYEKDLSISPSRELSTPDSTCSGRILSVS